MNGKLAGIVGVFGIAVVVALGYAQPPAERPIDERVTALEREITRVVTRVDLREAAASPGATTALAARVTELERTLARLTTDVQRVERQADSALREATAAQRAAQDAERLARDAATRR